MGQAVPRSAHRYGLGISRHKRLRSYEEKTTKFVGQPDHTTVKVAIGPLWAGCQDGEGVGAGGMDEAK